MIFERKIVVGFDDVRGIIFECTKSECRARMSVSPDSLHGVPRSCSSCGTPWRLDEIPTHVTTSAGAPLALVQAIRMLRIMGRETQPPRPFKILLEFDEPEA